MRHKKLTGQQEILFLGIKRVLPPNFNKRIENVLKKDINWEGFLKQSRYYNLSQLLYHNLKSHGLLNLFPADVQKELKKDYIKTNSLSLAYYSELKVVLKLLKEARIDCLVLKGAALAPTLYKNLGLRSFGDIDILIHPEETGKAEALLKERYHAEKPLSYSSKINRCFFHRCYIRNMVPRLSMELHWGLFSPTMPLALNLDGFWKKPQVVVAAHVEFFVPQREFLFLHQCLHFSGHYFLSWRDLWDIDWFLSEEVPLDWNIIVETAKKHYLEARIFYPLIWSQQQFDTSPPPEVMKELTPKETRKKNLLLMIQYKGGVLSEPARRNKDFRIIIDFFLLVKHQRWSFCRRLCWPGIAWLTIFPDNQRQNKPLQEIIIFLRGLRLLFLLLWHLLKKTKELKEPSER